jgi:hypothetical protein
MSRKTMQAIGDRSPMADPDRILLVMLPGAHMKPADFIDCGFVAALRVQDWPIDVLAVDTGMDCYLDDSIVDRLHEDIILPAQASGARPIWLLGISLGGMGALLYAQAHGAAVRGIILLSPFIGTRGLIAEIEQAGGLRQWPGPAGAPTPEQALLAWLAQYQASDQRWAKLLLAYGVDDRFAAAHRLLADLLPRDRILTAPGGHDWETWTRLWHEILETAPFTSDPVSRC